MAESVSHKRKLDDQNENEISNDQSEIEKNKNTEENHENDKKKKVKISENTNIKNKKETTSILTNKNINSNQTNMKQTKLSFFKAPAQKDDWLIEDYLYDKEWKNLLKDEFEKGYFIEINKQIKDGYKKDINRPPKELVFNALNSTKITDVILNINLF
jgi:hypothetical protein